MMKAFTLQKKERLASRSRIEELFGNGSAFFIRPLRIIYLQKPVSTTPGAKILVSVPRKKFKKAVTRNRIKRLIREAYRLNKFILQDSVTISLTTCLNIGFIYVGYKEDISFREIEKAMVLALTRLVQEVNGKL